MGFFDELVGDIVDIAKQEAKRAIISGLREEFGHGDRNVSFHMERQTSGNARRNTQARNMSRLMSNRNNDQYQNTNSMSGEKGGYNMAEDITENSEITQYQNASKALCIKVKEKSDNGKYYHLDNDRKTLTSKHPKMDTKAVSTAHFFNEIIINEFVDGISKTVFVRNYTLDDNPTNRRLAMRPQRIPGDFFSRFLPENVTLLFKGYVQGNRFVVDGVSEQYNEDVLPYEVECSIIRYDDENRVRQSGGNFLFDLVDSAASLNEHTKERLEEWKDYIKWRRTIVKKRMHGARYVNVDSKDGNLVFTLQFPDKDSYDAEAKWLKRGELAAYDSKEYSDKDGNFEYNEERHRWNEKFEPVGSQVRRLSKDGHEVNGYYEIKLVYAVPDSDEIEEMTDEEREEYVQNQLLPRYSQTGFLAPLVIKDLSLFKRLDRAVTDLQQDRDCHSPNMAMWIFDVTRARLPQADSRQEWENRIGNNWLNRSIADNPNQREAIFKMLEAPDLCLIQGPPGTGKTTVIAEAIYQFARQGNCVLLASQSHDAVDNALDRLANRSEIRAIRLSERDRDRDEERSKFGVSKVLSTYYGTLSQSVTDKFLTPWNKNRQDYNDCERELRDFRHVVADLADLNREFKAKSQKLEYCRHNLSDANNDLQEASKENDEHENAKRQYMNFKGKVERHEISGGDFYIPNNMGDIVATIFGQLIHTVAEQGVILASFVSEDVLRREPTLSIGRIAKSCGVLFALRNKLSEATKNASTDASIAKLKIQEIEEQILKINAQLAEEDDFGKRKKLKDEREALRDEKEKLGESGVFVLSPEELALFDEERKAQLQSPEGQAGVAQILSDIGVSYQSALQKLINRMGEIIDSYQPKDIEYLSERVKSHKGQIKYLQEEMQRKREAIAAKEKLGETLSNKYNCERGEIESRIESEINRLKAEWNREDSIRQVWQGTLEKFTERLNDPKTAKYDKEYYESIYISSCNVVGITCAANMRDLDEKFPDFDVVIIDEVSKATPPELLPPLMRARKTILVGDHRQLPPVFNEYEKSYNELLEEINAEIEDDDDEEGGSKMVLRKEDLDKYRTMVTSSLFREYFEQADERIKHSLLTQYRMHSDIQKVINRFYDGKLISGVKEVESKTKAHGLRVMTDKGESFLRPDSHAYWVDSSKLQGKLMEQSRYPGSTSLHNIFERHIILSMLGKINDAYAAMGKSGITVGVISFYGSQVGDLRKAVKDMRNRGKLKALKVDVNTVDRFQGKEKQIIIISLVCNTKRGNASRHVAAFERINVAFSRAQNLLIIVGARELYSGLVVPIPNMDTGEIRSARIYQGIVDDIARNGALIVGETLIAQDDIPKIMEEYDKEAKDGEVR